MRERGVLKQLWFWVIVAIVAGIVFGLVAPGPAEKAKWLADAFIQLIKAVTGPVIFLTVVIGIASLGNLARAGGLALRALALLLLDDGDRARARPARGQHLRAGLGLRRRAERVARRRRPRSRSPRPATPRPASSASSPTTCCRRASSRRSSRTRSCASSCWRSSSPRRSRCSPTASARRSSSVFEVASRVVFGIIRLIMWVAPLGAFGGMAYTVVGVRRGLADVAGRADGRLLGHLRVLRRSSCSARSRALSGLLASSAWSG